MAIFKGAGVAIVTPMKENGDVNFEKLGEILEEQIAAGTDAVIICGTTGESSTLSHEEHMEAIRYTIDKVNKRIPVVAGTGSNCTETAIMMSQEAERMGADGLLLVSPYYNKATQKGLIAHYTAIANSVKLPIILYNIAGRTGINIEPKTLLYLAENVENIVAVKEASGNISQIADIAAMCKGKLDIYSGNDDQITPIMALGGIGVISVLSNIAPKYTHDLAMSYLEGDVQKSCEMQLKALPLVRALFPEVEMAAGIDLEDKGLYACPVFTDIEKCDVPADVMIDFSSAKATDKVLEYCGSRKLPLVLCTTGLSQEQIRKVEETAKQTAILRSANMSLGINTLLKLIQDAAKVLAAAGFDMEIVERHHNLKVDAPSGTALALADSLNEAMDNQYHYVYDRSQKREKRDPREIGISAVRGGTIVGDHEVIFAGPDEVIEFKHTAYSKTVFAKGAVEAAKFLKGKGAGLYNMSHVINAGK